MQLYDILYYWIIEIEVVMNDKYYMNLALQEAKKAKDIDEIPIGCVIVKDGKIIGKGYNRVEIENNPIKHAELIAIEEASRYLSSWRLYGCTLYVTLEPCAMCSGAIIYSRIDRIVFGAYDYKRGFCGSIENLPQREEMNHYVEISGGIEKEKCLEIIQEFFKNLRTKKQKSFKLSKVYCIYQKVDIIYQGYKYLIYEWGDYN